MNRIQKKKHHRKIFIAASKAGKSINAWMDEVLSIAADNAINTNS
jgi:predicted HicB family RNase H-like nuclease